MESTIYSAAIRPAEMHFEPNSDIASFEDWESACRENGLQTRLLTTIEGIRVYECWRQTSSRTGAHLGAFITYVGALQKLG